VNNWHRKLEPASRPHPLTPKDFGKEKGLWDMQKNNAQAAANAAEHAKGVTAREQALVQSPPLPQWP
jgi:hypothetical protein